MRAFPLALALLTSAIAAAPASRQERFESAKIHRFAPEPGGTGFPIGVSGGPGTANPARIVYTNCTLKDLVTLAYSVKDYQVEAPAWMDSIGARFTIEATIPPAATQSQVNHMLQNLLAERFKLALHRETKASAVQELRVAGHGPKLKPASRDPKSRPGMLAELVAQDGARRITARSQTIDQLADQLSSPALMAHQSGGPILNRTGLTGTYDFVLEYAATASELDTMKRSGFPDAAGKAAHLPDLSGALQQQLGLKLQSKEEPLEMLVVDHCEKQPAEKQGVEK